MNRSDNIDWKWFAFKVTNEETDIYRIDHKEIKYRETQIQLTFLDVTKS